MKRIGIIFVSLVISFIVAPHISLAVGTTVNFTTNGSYTVPSGVTSLEVILKGGGGGFGGGGYHDAMVYPTWLGKSGGNGALVQKYLTVTPGQVLNIYVGKGGDPGGYACYYNCGTVVAYGGSGYKSGGNSSVVWWTSANSGGGGGGSTALVSSWSAVLALAPGGGGGGDGPNFVSGVCYLGSAGGGGGGGTNGGAAQLSPGIGGAAGGGAGGKGSPYFNCISYASAGSPGGNGGANNGGASFNVPGGNGSISIKPIYQVTATISQSKDSTVPGEGFTILWQSTNAISCRVVFRKNTPILSWTFMFFNWLPQPPPWADTVGGSKVAYTSVVGTYTWTESCLGAGAVTVATSFIRHTVFPAPIVPAPIVPAPIVPAPIVPAPIVPAPIVPAPIVPAPIVPAPIVPAPNYSLTTVANPPVGGSVTKTPNGTTYLGGSKIDIEAVPAPGYKFSSWVGSVANNFVVKTSVLMDSNKTVVVNFTKIILNCVGPNGSVILNGDSLLYYKNPLVISPKTCIFELRTCNNKTLSGSYVVPTCRVVDPGFIEF